MNPEQIKFLRENFQRIGKRLDDARELRKYSKGRFPLVIKESFFDTQLPDHQDIRILAEWLSHDARLLAQNDEMENALRSCESALALGCAFRDDPILICFLIQCAMYNTAVPSIERVLAQGEVSDEALLRLQKRAIAELNALNSVTAMRGERAGQHLFFEGVRAGRQKLGGWVAFGRNNITWMDDVREWSADTMPGFYLSEYPDYLRSNNELVEITKLPFHERKEKLEAYQSKTYETKNIVARTFAVAGSSVHTAEGRTRGMLISVAVAIACERYRMQHPRQAWPNSLEDVVKKGLLAELPRDPIDNQALRFRVTKEGVVVYSIGPDGTDDGGKIDRERTNQTGVDIGVRLWNIELRRQRALPAPAEPEVKN